MSETSVKEKRLEEKVSSQKLNISTMLTKSKSGDPSNPKKFEVLTVIIQNGVPANKVAVTYLTAMNGMEFEGMRKGAYDFIDQLKTDLALAYTFYNAFKGIKLSATYARQGDAYIALAKADSPQEENAVFRSHQIRHAYPNG